MRMQTALMPGSYLSAIRKRMGSCLALGSERFTGIFIGRVFYVTHHAGYEWNRRITNQKNAALGYVRKTECGSEVRFLCFQSALCPQYFILCLLFLCAYLLLTMPIITELPLLTVIAVLIIIGVPLLVTLFEICSEGSMYGRKKLLGLLMDPTDHFAHLNHRNKIK